MAAHWLAPSSLPPLDTRSPPCLAYGVVAHPGAHHGLTAGATG